MGMTLEQATAYADKKLAEGHKSDGCTMAPDLGIKWCCVMHDMLRRFRPIQPSEADLLFLWAIKTNGYRYYPIGWIYYSIAVLARKMNFYH